MERLAVSAGRRSSEWQDAIVILAGTAVLVTVVATLYWAQAFLIPLALAVFLTFVLSPIVNAIQRRGVPRVPAVIAVMLLVAIVLGGLVAVVLIQSGNLMQELPKHRHTIREKVRSLRELVSSESTSRIQVLWEDVWREIDPPSPGEADISSTPAAPDTGPPSPRFSWQDFWPTVFSSGAAVVGALVLTLVFVAFMLLQREDLRNRFVRLMGGSRVATTTKAMDDVGRRLSRFLLMQLFINALYGAALGIALALLQIPYAFLWGVLAAVLRYIPYVGPWLAAIAPVLLTIATSDGWLLPIVTIGIIVVLELITNNLLEPYLYGSSLGASPTALLVAAAFWAFLWGPVGLILSGPMTVILLVVGQRVTRLRVFAVLLGEEPPLEPHVRLFQRLIAHDQNEAADLLVKEAEQSDWLTVCDDVVLPATAMVADSLERGEIDSQDAAFVAAALTEIVEYVLEPPTLTLTGEPPPEDDHDSLPARPTLLICPVKTEWDVVAASLLVKAVGHRHWRTLVASQESLLSELQATIDHDQPSVVCILGLAAGNIARIRYLCKRIRLPNASRKLWIALWGGDPSEVDRDHLQELGAHHVFITLRETLEALAAWQPVVESTETVRHHALASVQ